MVGAFLPNPAKPIIAAKSSSIAGRQEGGCGGEVRAARRGARVVPAEWGGPRDWQLTERDGLQRQDADQEPEGKDEMKGLLKVCRGWRTRARPGRVRRWPPTSIVIRQTPSQTKPHLGPLRSLGTPSHDGLRRNRTPRSIRSVSLWSASCCLSSRANLVPYPSLVPSHSTRPGVDLVQTSCSSSSSSERQERENPVCSITSSRTLVSTERCSLRVRTSAVSSHLRRTDDCCSRRHGRLQSRRTVNIRSESSFRVGRSRLGRRRSSYR